MKNQLVGLFFSLFAIITTGCSTTPKQVYMGSVKDDGIHQFSQEPEKWILVYNKRVLNTTARDIQRMDQAYRKAGVAVEHLGNLQEVAARNGISGQQLDRILTVAWWDSLEPEERRIWSSGRGYSYGSRYPYYRLTSSRGRIDVQGRASLGQTNYRAFRSSGGGATVQSGSSRASLGQANPRANRSSGGGGNYGGRSRASLGQPNPRVNR